MNKVIILGGSFDPIHNGHIAIIKHAMKELEINEGCLMIAGKPCWKTDYAPIGYRLSLLSKVLKNEKNIKICKEELYFKDVNFTYNTILNLKNKYKETEFYFLIGLDQLNLLHNWYNIDLLSKMMKFIVVKRPSYELNIKNFIKYNCQLLNYSGPDISSTEFKRTLKLELLPECIHDNIVKNGYYYKKKLRKMLNYKRYCHSVQVGNLAREIARCNNYDENKAFLAGLLHDCAKDIAKGIEMEIMHKLFKNYINEKELVYHQFIGSFLLKKEFNIYNEEITDAIMWHTTGTSNMSILAKIVFASDKIEPTRGFDSSDLIEACKKDINSGFLKVLKENYDFLVSEKGLKLEESDATKECLEYYKIV